MRGVIFLFIDFAESVIVLLPPVLLSLQQLVGLVSSCDSKLVFLLFGEPGLQEFLGRKRDLVWGRAAVAEYLLLLSADE